MNRAKSNSGDVLVSIVVPVYNVFQYLEKCVESILKQSFREFELILVDDGSTDNSGEICDKFAKSNRKVRVFHKNNEGLSVARNFGVGCARADYVVFVDSDDFVDDSYIQKLWNLKQHYKVDIAVTGHIKETDTGKIIEIAKPLKTQVLSSKDAIEKMCYGKNLPIMAYGKIYKKEILLQHPYPVGKLNEDIGTTYLLFYEASQIALGSSAQYHYVQREGSIVNQKFNKKHFYSIQASVGIIEFLRRHYPTIIYAGYARLALESTALLHRTFRASEEDFDFVTDRINKLLQKHWLLILNDSNIPRKTRAQLLFFKINPSLYRTIYIIFDRLRQRLT